MDPDWTNIPVDIGHEILCKLPELVDHVWFGAVCKNWNSILKKYNQLIRPSRGTLPMLFVPVTQCETQRTFYSMSYGKLFPNVTLSDIPNKRWCGSSNGWLAFVEEDFSVTLINPFMYGSGNTIHLPVLDIKRNERVKRYVDTISKLILSSDSTIDHHTVVAIYGGMRQLATFRSGDTCWTYNIVRKNEQVAISDILFHKALLYALSYGFKIFSIDINSSPPRVKILKQIREPHHCVDELFVRKYFVESTSGELYVLRRHRVYVDPDFLTSRLKVLKLELHKENDKVVRVVERKTLDGDCIFMSESYITAINASKFHWCKPNSIYYSIYYTDDRGGPDSRTGERGDFGIYHMKENSISKLYLDLKDSPKHTPGALWIQPNVHCS